MKTPTPETDALRELYETHEHRATVGDIWDLCEAMEKDRDSLRSAGDVLREALVKLMSSDEQLESTPDEDLEEAMKNGYSTEIRTQAESILMARKALGMTNYLFPTANPTEPKP